MDSYFNYRLTISLLINYIKLLCFNILIYLRILGWMRNSLLTIWILIEVVLVFIIGFMTLNKSYGVIELMMKYFVIQVFVSLVFLIFLRFYMFNLWARRDWWLIWFVVVKLRLFPFHQWFILILGKLDWLSFFILSRIVKFLPALIRFYIIQLIDIWPLVISTLIICSVSGLNNCSVQKMLGYSSIIHICWIICSLVSGKVLFLIYFLSYLSIIFWVRVLIIKGNIFFVGQIKRGGIDILSKRLTFLYVLSLAGFPPFLGFLIKWVVVFMCSTFSSKWMIFVLLITSLISTFFYLQTFFTLIMVHGLSVKWTGLSLKLSRASGWLILVSYLFIFIIY